MEMKQLTVELVDGLVVITQDHNYLSKEIKITPGQVALVIDFLYQTVESIPPEGEPDAKP